MKYRNTDKKHLKFTTCFLAALLCYALSGNVHAKVTCSDIPECREAADNLIQKNDYEGALPYHEAACQLDDGRSCFLLGLQYETGRGTGQNPEMARTYHKKACDLKFSAGCTNLGYIYAEGHGVSRDSSKAETYFEKACSLNDARGCDNLSQLYFDNKNPEKSLAPAVKSCRLDNDRGCLKAAVIYEYGLGTAKDNVKSLEYFQKACRLGNSTGCKKSGR